MRFLFYFLLFHFSFILKGAASYFNKDSSTKCSTLFSKQPVELLVGQYFNFKGEGHKDEENERIQTILSFLANNRSHQYSKYPKNSQFNQILPAVNQLIQFVNEMNKSVKEHSTETNQKIAEQNKETDRKILKQNKEFNRMIARQNKETDRKIVKQNEEFDQMIARQNKETDRMIAKQKKEINRMIAKQNKELDQIIAKQNEEFDQMVAKQNEEFDQVIAKQNEEFNQMIAKQNKEFDRMIVKQNEEIAQMIAESDVKMDEMRQAIGGVSEVLGKLIEKLTKSRFPYLSKQFEINFSNSVKQILENEIMDFSEFNDLKLDQEFDVIAVEKNFDKGRGPNEKKRIFIIRFGVRIAARKIENMLSLLRTKDNLDQFLEHITEIMEEHYTRENTSVHIVFSYLKSYQKNRIQRLARQFRGVLFIKLNPQRGAIEIISNPYILSQDFNVKNNEE